MFSEGTFVPVPKLLSIESPENTCSSPSPAQMMQRSTCRLCSERGINAICGGPLLLQFTGVVDFALKQQLGYSFQIYFIQTWTFSLLCPSYSLLGFRRSLQSWVHNILEMLQLCQHRSLMVRESRAEGGQNDTRSWLCLSFGGLGPLLDL